jgi:hypothetical protein
MSSVIWKYPLRLEDRQMLSMPQGARVLAFGNQRGTPTMWALVEPEAQREAREVFIVGTGRLCTHVEAREYVGTAQFEDGELVWHLFIDPAPKEEPRG